jgi:hypothetical protein
LAFLQLSAPFHIPDNQQSQAIPLLLLFLLLLMPHLGTQVLLSNFT